MKNSNPIFQLSEAGDSAVKPVELLRHAHQQAATLQETIERLLRLVNKGTSLESSIPMLTRLREKESPWAFVDYEAARNIVPDGMDAKEYNNTIDACIEAQMRARATGGHQAK
ncbi:hypothetical protein [Xanthomonas hortorum]|uniref:hypothetical protein n=1 Tax=Xanthomonas TaxID=338 RepID=UPI0020CEA190|nr:hypothetical protein [Xanthomonas hortorum]UTS71799.1 hypothetical protein NMB96_14830 [Xanthomonas hortorum]